ncbi:MAG: 23S rRNA (guanosine2251-2'-O)-methyltransferase, partial [Candidatus Azotimanducaceae bacterium]
KAEGIWVVGTDGDSSATYTQPDMTVPTAVVMGSEGSGLRRLTAELCDYLVSIPMSGSVSSLNVSVACGVLLFEAVRQRG